MIDVKFRCTVSDGDDTHGKQRCVVTVASSVCSRDVMQQTWLVFEEKSRKRSLAADTRRLHWTHPEGSKRVCLLYRSTVFSTTMALNIITDWY